MAALSDIIVSLSSPEHASLFRTCYEKLVKHKGYAPDIPSPNQRQMRMIASRNPQIVDLYNELAARHAETDTDGEEKRPSGTCCRFGSPDIVLFSNLPNKKLFTFTLCKSGLGGCTMGSTLCPTNELSISLTTTPHLIAPLWRFFTSLRSGLVLLIRKMVSTRQQAAPRASTASTAYSPAPTSPIATPISTPRQGTPRSETATMQYLRTYVKSYVEPSTYNEYHKLIERLERVGPKQPKVRVELHRKLQNMCHDDNDLLELNNEVAKAHNEGLAGMHARYLLPVFETMEDEEGNQLHAQDETKERVAEPGQIHRVDGHITLPTSDQLSHASENRQDVRKENDALRNLAEQPHIVRSESNIMQLAMRNEDVRSNGEDVERLDAPIDDETQMRLDSISLIRTATDKPPSEGSITTPRNESPSGNKCGTMAMTNRESGSFVELGSRGRQTSMVAPRRILRALSSERLPKTQSAASYLAWLDQRGTRWPETPPFSAECVAISDRIKRPATKVIDEVQLHWLLETDGKRGDWHKAHRLEILGDDPRFHNEAGNPQNAWLNKTDSVF
ncbi:hypothetical protein T440DRAFT_547117 [Plenodomus tracheiphilus IPT5]|uniref:Uncharacterized protein n=1 Tax=Plenodomus tracheiphilus IPT5 TaxID=1408161 RepID=A0A6A7ANH4_9PLEO|nr:hypothetical protein T440DRAFT_547117 [Plenodomus tracheiphilus IPT5]